MSTSDVILLFPMKSMENTGFRIEIAQKLTKCVPIIVLEMTDQSSCRSTLCTVEDETNCEMSMRSQRSRDGSSKTDILRFLLRYHESSCKSTVYFSITHKKQV